MNHSKKYIRKMLLEGLLENKLKKLDSFVSLRFSNDPIIEDPDTKDRIFNKFLEKKKIIEEIETKLSNPEKLNHIGEYIWLLINKFKVDNPQRLENLNFKDKKIMLMLKNNIDITEMDLKKFVEIIFSLNISLFLAKKLIEKSFKLYHLNASPIKAMARYSYKDGLNERNQSMKKGLDELLLKASQKQSFNSELNNPEHKKLLVNFLEKFENEYNKCFYK